MGIKLFIYLMICINFLKNQDDFIRKDRVKAVNIPFVVYTDDQHGTASRKRRKARSAIQKKIYIKKEEKWDVDRNETDFDWAPERSDLLLDHSFRKWIITTIFLIKFVFVF